MSSTQIFPCAQKLQTLKKPDRRLQAQCSIGANHMNYSILADIELNRKISLFQKAVEAYVLNRTLENSMALAKAKAELTAFVLRGV